MSKNFIEQSLAFETPETEELTLEELKFSYETGIKDPKVIREKMQMKKNEKYLNMHPYNIWEYVDKKGKSSWQTYLPDIKNGRRRIKKSSQKELYDVVIAYWKEKEYNPTIDEVFNEWNDYRLEKKKIRLSTHTRNKQYYIRHYKQMGKRYIKDLKCEDIVDFLEEQIFEFGLNAKAFSNIKTITKNFLKRAKKRKLIDWNVEQIFEELDVSDAEFTQKIKEDYEEVFDIEETEAVLKHLRENLDTKNLAIMLMFYTGMRVGEVVALKPEMLDDDIVRVRRTETRWIDKDGHYVYEVADHTKTSAGNRDVVVPELFTEYYEKIKNLNPYGEYVFCNGKGERYTTVAIRRRLERVCKTTEVYKKSPHKIRKTYVTMLLDSNVDKKFITKQVGHTNILCSEEHYHRDRKGVELKKAILNQVPEFECK